MSFLLDTNILSNLRNRKKTDPNLLKWAVENSGKRHYISVITIGEIRKGIEIKRRKAPDQCAAFVNWLRRIKVDFGDDILPVTGEIMETWGHLMAKKSVAYVDSFIAATALHYDLTLVTRNTRDFQDTGIDLINPFESE